MIKKSNADQKLQMESLDLCAGSIPGFHSGVLFQVASGSQGVARRVEGAPRPAGSLPRRRQIDRWALGMGVDTQCGFSSFGPRLLGTTICRSLSPPHFPQHVHVGSCGVDKRYPERWQETAGTE